MTTSNELYHHGILGMKWGQRRYQDKNGKLTSAGRKRYGSNPIKKFTTKIKRKKALEKARKTREENRKKAEELKKNKAEWVKDPTKLKKHIDEFTNDELTEAITRLQLQKSVADLNYAKLERGKKYIDLVGGIAKDATAVAAMAKTMKQTWDEFHPEDKTKDKKDGGNDKPKSDSDNDGNSGGGSDKPKNDGGGGSTKVNWITADDVAPIAKTLNDVLYEKANKDIKERTANYNAAYSNKKLSEKGWDMAVDDAIERSYSVIDTVNEAIKKSGFNPDDFKYDPKKK